MSKTDKTDPFWVKRRRYGHEDHDHRDGICNIAHNEADSWLDCHLEIDWSDPMNRCGCKMCTMQDYRKEQNRKARRAGKRYTQTWHKEY